MSREEAKEYLRQNAGTYFDPSLVGLFVDHVETLEAEAAQIAAAHPGLVSHHMASAASSAEPAAGLARQPNQDRVAAALHTISTTNREVAALFEVSRTLGSSLSLQDMMAILANRLSKIVPFSTCGLAIFDSSRMEYEFVHAIGANGDRFLHRRGPITAGIVGWVIQNRKPMYNTSAVLDLAFLDAETGNRYRTAMVFPLLKDDWVLGAIALYSMETEAYTTEHAGLMETISKPISDALYKALAFEQAKAASLVDTSTGLASVGAFANQFEREFARCRRLGVSLSVVVVNTHTPAYGTDSTTDDWPAAALGRLILENVREIDIVSMYSGGCFAILLPESGSDETAEVLSRLKGVLGSASRTLGVTITLGSASYPMDGESMEDLLRAATLAPSSLATACAAYAGSSIQ